MTNLLLIILAMLVIASSFEMQQIWKHSSKQIEDKTAKDDSDVRDSRLWLIEMYKLDQMALYINQSFVTFQGGSYTADRLCLEDASTIVDPPFYRLIPLNRAVILGDALLAKCETLQGYYLITNNTKWFMLNTSNFYHYGFDPHKVIRVTEDYLNEFPLAYYF